MRIVVEVDRHQRLVAERQHALQRALGSGLQQGVDLVAGGVALWRKGQVNHRDIRRRHADGRTIQLALQLGQNLAYGAGGAGGGGDHAHRGGSRTAGVAVDLIEDLLIVGIAVDGGHQPALDPDGIVQHLGKGREAVGGAAGVGHDGVFGGQLVVVDAVNHRQINALGRRRDQHALGAGSDVLAGAVAVGEEAGAFQRDIDAHCLVRQVGGVALGGDGDAVAIDDQIGAINLYRAVEGAVDRIALEQQGVGLGVGQIVDRDQFQPAVGALEYRARHLAADAAKPVNCNFYSHLPISYHWFWSAVITRGTILAGVKPK